MALVCVATVWWGAWPNREGAPHATDLPTWASGPLGKEKGSGGLKGAQLHVSIGLKHVLSTAPWPLFVPPY